jgi:hypothetical protein
VWVGDVVHQLGPAVVARYAATMTPAALSKSTRVGWLLIRSSESIAHQRGRAMDSSGRPYRDDDRNGLHGNLRRLSRK